MSTSQVDFYTNRLGKFEKMRRDGRVTNKQTNKTRNGKRTHTYGLWHIYGAPAAHRDDDDNHTRGLRKFVKEIET